MAFNIWTGVPVLKEIEYGKYSIQANANDEIDEYIDFITQDELNKGVKYIKITSKSNLHLTGETEESGMSVSAKVTTYNNKSYEVEYKVPDDDNSHYELITKSPDLIIDLNDFIDYETFDIAIKLKSDCGYGINDCGGELQILLYTLQETGEMENKQIQKIWVGTPEGNKEVTNIYVGTPNGNKQITQN